MILLFWESWSASGR